MIRALLVSALLTLPLYAASRSAATAPPAAPAPVASPAEAWCPPLGGR